MATIPPRVHVEPDLAQPPPHAWLSVKFGEGSLQVNLDGIDGPLRFYQAESRADGFITLVHRDNGTELRVGAQTLLDRVKAGRVRLFPGSTQVLDMLIALLPGLCEGCGALLQASEAGVCDACRRQAVADLVRISSRP